MRDDDGGPSPDATPRLVTELAAERKRLDLAMRDLANSRDVLDGVIDAASKTSTSG
jgi:hypothetical protein